MSDKLYVEGIDIASNEYLTKFSINRNFEVLLSNDSYLQVRVDEQDLSFYSYNPNKTYSKDDLVFYKTSQSSTMLYLLKSKKSNNQNLPSTKKNALAQDVVVEDDFWAIVGIPSSSRGLSPTDIAFDYVESAKEDFYKIHESNTDLSAHPLGKFGRNESKILFSSMKNIDENRSVFFYPYKIKKLLTDDTIQGGYMRKWDNGIVEYDIIYRLGYSGKSDDGSDIISANSVSIQPLNYNYLYFKNKDDYKIFNQGGQYQAIVNDQKEVNLNKKINSFSGTISFPEEFKDLNYMVFTSGVKNSTTRTKNTTNDVITDYDERLTIVGTTITGHTIDSSKDDYHTLYRKSISIPDQVKTIADESMQDITWGRQSQGLTSEVTLNISQDSELVNIGDNSFSGTNLTSFTTTKNVRRIGNGAFSGCGMLATLDFYIYSDSSKQPKIEKNAFSGTKVTTVNIHYVDSAKVSLFASSEISEEERRLSSYSDEISLADRFRNQLIRKYQFGIDNDVVVNEDSNRLVSIVSEQSPAGTRQLMTTAVEDKQQQDFSFNDNSISSSQTSSKYEPGYISINVLDFLRELSSDNLQKNISKTYFKTSLFKASDPIVTSLSVLSTYFYLQGNDDETSSIIGVKDDLPENFALDFTRGLLNDSTIRGLTSIGDSAFKNCLKLSSVVISYPIIAVLDDAFNGCSNLDNIVISSNITSIGHKAFSNCGDIQSCKLSCPDLDSGYLYQPNTFDNTTFKDLSLLQCPILSSYSSTRGYLSISSENLFVDMTDGFFSNISLSGSVISSISLWNIKDGKKITVGEGASTRVLSSFEPGALYGCSTDYIIINNDSRFTIQGIVVGDKVGGQFMNILSAQSKTLFVNQISTIAIVNDDVQYLDRIKNYLFVKGLSVVSLDYYSLLDDGDISVDINKNIVAISDDSMKVQDSEYQDLLLEVSLPESLRYIGNNAFSGNRSLTAVNVPKDLDLEYIGLSAFAHCDSLGDLEFLKTFD